ncbi:MAG: family 10 glycosylhydrolase, partial [Euryarchaeota archaeon]|nr:family 10 glycosylhydrolase [Euryarchaeota archaeon]
MHFKKPFFKRSVFRKRFTKGTIALILILCVALVAVQTVTASSTVGDTDVILVGTRNWQDVIAATPLAISEAENAARPLLLVPTGVDTGERYSWLENADLVKYGVPPIINKLKSGNVSTVIINVKDDSGFVYFPSEVVEEDAISQDINVTKVFIDKAHEEGLSVFAALSSFRDPITVGAHPEWCQVDNEDKRSEEWVCPLNDEYKEYLLNLTAEVLGYDIDGVVLSDFGYAGSDYCFCDLCKRGFWNDTGIDPGKVDLANRYSSNTQKWLEWRASLVTDFLVSFSKHVKKIDPEITIGARMQNPFDDYYPAGYDREEIASPVELMLIDPIGTRDIRILSQDIGEEAAIYIFWRKTDIEDTMSVPNVEGTIRNMEDAKAAGATGVVLDYDIAYTPIWLELKTMPHSTSWFISQYLPDHVTIIGDADVSLPLDVEVSRICGTDIFDTAARIASYQNQSQGVVLLNSTDYHSAVEAAPLASYLGYPILYVSAVIPNSTGDALNILDTNEVIVIGTVNPELISDLEAMNISVSQGDANEMLIREMAKKGEEVNAVVFTNTRDFELTSPKPKSLEYEKEIGDILVSTELFPAEVPCDQEGTTFYITVKVKNTGDDVVEDIIIQDTMPCRRTVESAIAATGNVSILKKRELTWEIGDLHPNEVARLSIEGALDFAMDSGEEKSIDEGIVILFDGIKKFLP